MFELRVTTRFAAAHQLRIVGHKCENLHGHNWKVEVTLRGNELADNGLLVDFGDIKIEVARIMDSLDHKFLNEIPAFGDAAPSSENIARYIATELGRALDSDKAKVHSVTAWESEDACATYFTD